MEFMGWNTIFEMDEVVGYRSGTNEDVWFVKTQNKEVQDHDGIGMNHISFRVNTISDVDVIHSFLEKKDIKMLFDTPKHRPEFSSSPKETYYQIMFKSPDGILFEVVYVGKK